MLWVTTVALIATALAAGNQPQLRTQGQKFPGDLANVYYGRWRGDVLSDDDHRPGIIYLEILEHDDDLESNEWSFINGALILRQSGIEHDAYLGFSGIYNRPAGQLLLYANMPDWRSRPEVLSITGPNAIEDSEDRLPPRSHPSPLDSHVLPLFSVGACSVAMDLRVLPLILDQHSVFDAGSGDLIWRQGSRSPGQATIAGSLKSPTCRFTITTAISVARPPDFIDRAYRFSTLASIATFYQMLATIRQFQSGHLGRVSLFTILVLALLDAYLCVIHVGIGMRVPELWMSFILLAMIEFLLFSVFHVRLIFLIWKSNNNDLFESGTMDRRQIINRLHTRLFLFILIGLFAIFLTIKNYELFITVLLHSAWSGQIVSNLRNDTNRGLLRNYVLVMAFTRLLLPLLKFGDPSYYKANSLNYTFCYLLLIWVGLQVLLLYLQDRLGPRFFVPAAFKPAKYQYFRPVEILASDVCAICMMETLEDVESQLDPDAGNVMVTPCFHKFHTICLVTWMDQKMECPNCRTLLPPL